VLFSELLWKEPFGRWNIKLRKKCIFKISNGGMRKGRRPSMNCLS